MEDHTPPSHYLDRQVGLLDHHLLFTFGDIQSLLGKRNDPWNMKVSETLTR